MKASKAEGLDAHLPYGIAIKTEAKIGEHTSELQSHSDLVCRLLLEKKKITKTKKKKKHNT